MTKRTGRLTHDEQLSIMADILKAAGKLDQEACLYVAKRLLALTDGDGKAEPAPPAPAETLPLPFLPQRDRSPAGHDA